MKNQDILRLAATFLQMEEALEHPAMAEGYLGGLEGADSVTVTLRQLLRCCDLVVKTVAAEYQPLIKSGDADIINGKLDLSGIPETVTEVLRLTQGGRRVAFRQAGNGIFSSAKGRVTVTYAYEPASGGIAAELDYAESLIPARVFAYGTAAEYCIISAMYDEAALWDKRFKDALRTVCRKKAEIRLPARRWR